MKTRGPPFLGVFGEKTGFHSKITMKTRGPPFLGVFGEKTGFHSMAGAGNKEAQGGQNGH
jgi:hypothetical protein